MTSPRAARKSPGRLSFEVILDAASELIDAEGFDALSMRKLAAHCEVGVMTLYGYVRTKEELLGALADRFLAEIELPEAGDRSWQEEIAAVFRSVHRVFLDHPELAQIVARQPVHEAAAYRGANVVLGALTRAGLSDAEAVSAFDALVSFTVGATQRENASQAGGASQLMRIKQLPQDDFQHVVRLAGLMASRDSQSHFEDGLDLLIRGIADRVRADG